MNANSKDKSTRAENIKRLLKSREKLEEDDFIAQQVKCLGFLSKLAETLRGRTEVKDDLSDSLSISE